LIAVACSDAAPPPAAAPPAPPAQAAVTVPATPAAPEPAPVSLQADTYTYNPAGRRDPFQSLIVSGGKRSLEFLPPLQRREVSELKLVAVVWGSLGTYGLLEMPDGGIRREGWDAWGPITGWSNGSPRRTHRANATSISSVNADAGNCAGAQIPRGGLE
jgi:hypothetical protein